MEVPRHWRLRAQRYRLEGSLCPGCGKPTFPPRPVCSHCIEQSGWRIGYGLQMNPPLSHRVDTVSVERLDMVFK